MSHDITPESDLPARRGLPEIFRAVLTAGAWLPFFAMVIFLLPLFTPIFTKLEEKASLPTPTFYFMAFERLNAATYWLPTLVFFAILILLNLGIARTTEKRVGSAGVYRAWVSAMIWLASLSCLYLAYAILLPVFKMSSVVH